MAKVFISHSSKDRGFAAKLSDDLVKLGHTPWLDAREIMIGDSIQTKIETGISGADYVVVVLSEEATHSRWVDKEWKLKLWDEVEQNRVLVLPVLLSDCEIPQFLKDKKYADFRKDYPIGLAQLAVALTPKVVIDPSLNSERHLSNYGSSFLPSSYGSRAKRPKLYNLPRPGEVFVKRAKYFDEVMKTLDLENRALGTAIEGVGGVGKTTIAIEVAEHCRKEGLFERIIWTTAQTQRLVLSREGRSAPGTENFYELEGLLDEIIRAFGLTSILACSVEEKQRYVRKKLENSLCLLVIDNLESIRRYEMIADFLAYAPATTKVITTTRRQYQGQVEKRMRLPPMSFDEISDLVKGICELKKIDIPSGYLQRLYDTVGGIPLAVIWSLGQFSRPAGQVDKFTDGLDSLRKASGGQENERQILEFCFRESYEAVTPAAKEILNVLGIFPLPLDAQVLRAILEYDSQTLKSACEELVDIFSLVNREEGEGDEERLSILPWTRHFVRYALSHDKEALAGRICSRYAEHWISLHSQQGKLCAFTPNYKPLELPQGATPLDFAYHIHTEVGHGFEGALINSRPASIDQPIQNGDIVSIVVSDRQDCTNVRWLDYAHTKRAERAISMRLVNKKQAVAAIQSGNAFSLKCKLTNAEVEYEKAVKLDPHNSWARHKLGHHLRIFGETELALKLYRETISRDSKNPFAFEGIGAVFYQTGNFSEAVEHYEKALAIRADYRNALFGLSRCFCAQGRYREAEDLLARILKATASGRQLGIIHLFRMLVCLGLGDTGGAVHTHLDRSLHEFNQIAPHNRLGAEPHYGSHFLYYYSIALACGTSKFYSSYLKRAIEICELHGLLKEILVDLRCFRPKLLAMLQDAVKKQFPLGTISNKLRDIEAALRERLQPQDFRSRGL